MHQVTEFFLGLFSTENWPARWHCGTWSDFHGWLYIVSDLMIWLAYFTIPVIIIRYFTGKKGLVKFSRVYILFATFILLCGTTHFIDAVMFWLPMYRLNALVRFFTGIVSMLTVYHLFKILPVAFAQKTNVELENEIAKRKEAEKKLAEANNNLQSFAYMASHDLQQPLRNVNTYTTFLFKEKEQFTEKQIDYSNKIKDSVKRMQTLILDILKLSELTDDTVFTTANLNTAVKRATDELLLIENQKKVDIVTDHLPAVLGNEEYLTQLFINIIGNAIKFSTGDVLVKINSEIKNDKVVVSITDNGIGMDEANLEKIFMAFKRLHSNDQYAGSGIGLSICKRIVDIHKGSINVKSKIDEGTTFIIELPKA